MTTQEPGDIHPRVETVDRVQVTLACEHCAVTLEFVEALVTEGVFDHQASQLQEWHLTQVQYRELRRAARLHHDLGINPPGIALALDLLAQLESRGR